MHISVWTSLETHNKEFCCLLLGITKRGLSSGRSVTKEETRKTDRETDPRPVCFALRNMSCNEPHHFTRGVLLQTAFRVRYRSLVKSPNRHQDCHQCRTFVGVRWLFLPSHCNHYVTLGVGAPFNPAPQAYKLWRSSNEAPSC